MQPNQGQAKNFHAPPHSEGEERDPVTHKERASVSISMEASATLGNDSDMRSASASGALCIATHQKLRSARQRLPSDALSMLGTFIIGSSVVLLE